MTVGDYFAPLERQNCVNMRFSLRKTVQVLFLFVLMIFLNGYITVLVTNSALQTPEQQQVPVQVPVLGPRIHERNKRSLHGQENEIENSKSAVKSNHNRSNNQGFKVPQSSQKLELSENRLKEIRQSTKSVQSIKDYETDFLSQSRPTELSDIFISVKTTKKFHKERVDLLLNTWVSLAEDETYFFSDDEDDEYKQKTNGHFINTNCSVAHTREALCCKMSVEYDYYIASNKRWFCHVDDDTYINIPELSRLLRKYNHTGDWYLGKPSLAHPLEITDPESPGQRFAFWFATGGAGFCLSRGLALKMMPYTGGGKLRTVCSQIRLPDDCTIGFIIYYHIRKQLTAVQEFHSHLEGLWMIKPAQLDKQITLSYNRGKSDNLKNVVLVSGYSEQDDPSRFRSIHCRLFPYQKGCPQAST